MKTIFEWLKWGEFQLKEVADQEAIAESQYLLEGVLKKSKAQLLAQLNDPLALADVESFKKIILRRQKSEPLAYITKEKVFRGSCYQCKKGVFIPRPETEILVDQVNHFIHQNWNNEPGVFFELGSGTGIVSCEIAKQYPNVEGFSWDINPKATSLSQINAKAMNVKNVTWINADFFDQLDWVEQKRKENKNSILIANPPYIDKQDSQVSQDVRDFEPHEALFANNQGLEIIEKLIAFSQKCEMRCWIEIGVNQGVYLEKRYKNVKFINDLSGIRRVVLNVS